MAAADPTEPQRDPSLVFDDEDGDLFDFDELIEGAAAVADGLADELEQVLENLPEEPAAALPSAVSAAAPAPAPLRTPAPTPAPARVPERASEALPEPEDPPLSQTLRASRAAFLAARGALAPERVREERRAAARTKRLLAYGLAFLVVANLSLVSVVWKSAGPTEPTAAQDTAVADPGALPAPALASSRELPAETLGKARSEAYSVLDDVLRAVESGRYQRARRTAYGLLAVIDRVSSDERADIEARAGFLIAESYRLEASELAREGT